MRRKQGEGSGAKGSPDESQLTFECFRQQLQPMKGIRDFLDPELLLLGCRPNFARVVL
jgi:hypothetical protein